MAKSARALAHSSKVSKSGKPATVAAKRRRVPIAKKAAPTAPEPSGPNESALAHFSEVEDAFFNLADSYRAYECLHWVRGAIGREVGGVAREGGSA